MSEPTWQGETPSWWRERITTSVAGANAAISIPSVALGIWYLSRIGLGAPGAVRVCILMIVGVALAIGYWRVAYGPPTRLEPVVWLASTLANGASYVVLPARPLEPSLFLANPWPLVMFVASVWLLWVSLSARAG